VDTAVDAVALLRLTLLLAAALAPCAAAAHHTESSSLASAWNVDPDVALPLVISGALYAIGLRRLWKRAGTGRGVSRVQALRFALGWLLLAVALVSPLDAMGEWLFSAHMVQHEILMAVAAPLLVLGRPLEAWTWSLPAHWRAPLAGIVRFPMLRRTWAVMTDPLGAWTLHAAALWTWHVPALFQAALRHPALHAFQHACFLGTALLFWWAVFGRGVHRPDGGSLAGLFTTMMHSGALGALLTFAPHVWYGYMAGTTERFGLSPIEDQQLGGLVMWGPAGLAYLVAGLAIVASWMRRGSPIAAGPVR
jgi:putative membrane protein